MEKIEKIAGVHLGKAGDGTAVKPYVTPDEIDSSLLVGIPRCLNRIQYDIDDDNPPFVGVDAWNAYEFSTLHSNGFPLTAWLKISYSSNSPNIVESKSLKLYLNSFNMAKTISDKNDVYKLMTRITKDLMSVIHSPVSVGMTMTPPQGPRPFKDVYYPIDDYGLIQGIEFNENGENPALLECVYDEGRFPQRFFSKSLRSNCRVTNQPDWGDIYVQIQGKLTITQSSLLQYIVSMRKENHFHEEICEMVYKRIWDLIYANHDPKDNPDAELLVACLYTRRGGIDINPIRCSNHLLLQEQPLINAYSFCDKTMRQ